MYVFFSGFILIFLELRDIIQSNSHKSIVLLYEVLQHETNIICTTCGR